MSYSRSRFPFRRSHSRDVFASRFQHAYGYHWAVTNNQSGRGRFAAAFPFEFAVVDRPKLMMRQTAFCVAMAAIMVDFTLNANVLAYWGIPYTDEGGPGIAKLHPGTYLAGVAMLARLYRNGNPLHEIGMLIWREGGLALFIACMSLCLMWSACLTGTGNLVTLLDTFLPAGMIAFACADMTSEQTGRLADVVRRLLLLNATVAVAEAASGWHLVPVVTAGPEQAGEFRSFGLYDHPLTGAAATMMGLLCSAELIRDPFRRRLYQGWLIVALFAFGGRTALAVTIIATGLRFVAHVKAQTMARRLGFREFIPLLLIGLAVLPAIVAALAAGWAERLQRHLFWDASAQARIEEFHLLQLMRPAQLIFGCPRADLLALIEPLRLGYGVDVIENFWLLHFVTLGVCGFVVFMVGMAGLITWLWQRCDVGGRIAIVSLILVASTSNSLGRKSALLVMLVACVLARQRDLAAIGARPRIRGNLLVEVC